MALPCFYHPQLELNALLKLSREEASHALKSRRLKVGDKVKLIDGEGGYAEASITQCERNNVQVEIESIEQQQAQRASLTMAVALPKGDRAKVMVDMLTQLGVDEFVFLACQRSVTKLSENLSSKLKRAAIESCKQAHRAKFPKFYTEQISPFDLISKHGVNKLVFVADQHADQVDQGSSDQDMMILIGPEGGFSQEETSYLLEQQVNRLSLAPNILRTETAAVASAAWLLNHFLI